MIVLTRVDGSRLAINSDQIERLDEGPKATVVTLMNGNSYIVIEPLDAVVELVTEYHARVYSGRERAVRRRRQPVAGRTHLRIAGEQPDEEN